MSFSRTFLNLLAAPLKLRRKVKPRVHTLQPRILVIRRNRLGDMVYALPLLHALRRHFSQAHIVVACDPAGAPIARACPAVNDVVVLDPGWNPWQATLKNAARLQDYDWVIAAKGGFDRRLALLSRLTNAAIRIGFERKGRDSSIYYTDPIALPPQTSEEHQIDTLMRLLRPLGLVKATEFSVDLSITVPPEAREFAINVLSSAPFVWGQRCVIINISSTIPIKFREEDLITLTGRLLGSTNFVIGLVSAPMDQQRAHEIAECMGSPRITAIDPSGPLELAALLEHAAVLVTSEGESAHLAATVGTPALVLWSEGPFKKSYSRGKRHAFVHPQPNEKIIPVERVWQALQPFLVLKKDDLEKKWADFLEQPPVDLS